MNIYQISNNLNFKLPKHTSNFTCRLSSKCNISGCGSVVIRFSLKTLIRNDIFQSIYAMRLTTHGSCLFSRYRCGNWICLCLHIIQTCLTNSYCQAACHEVVYLDYLRFLGEHIITCNTRTHDQHLTGHCDTASDSDYTLPNPIYFDLILGKKTSTPTMR